MRLNDELSAWDPQSDATLIAAEFLEPLRAVGVRSARTSPAHEPRAWSSWTSLLSTWSRQAVALCRDDKRSVAEATALPVPPQGPGEQAAA